MKYNHFDMLPERAFLKLGGKIMPQGGGSSGQTSSTTNTSNIPEYAQPYVMPNLGKGQALTDISNNPYQPYQGQMLAGFTPMQTQAMTALGDMQQAPQLQQGTDIANQASQGGMGYGAAGFNAGMSYGQNAQDPNAVASYMNPYLQNTLAPAQQLLNQQYGMQSANQQGAATSNGAFGGSREALMSSLGQQNANLASNQLIGNAYNQAYNTANQNMQQASTLGMQGAQTGISGLNTALQGANTLNTLGNSSYNQDMGINQAQLAAGNQQQQQQQKGLDTAYNQYQQQLQYPYQQLSFMQGLYSGLPMTNAAQTMYQAQPPMSQQVMGMGLGAAGAAKAFS